MCAPVLSAYILTGGIQVVSGVPAGVPVVTLRVPLAGATQTASVQSALGAPECGARSNNLAERGLERNHIPEDEYSEVGFPLREDDYKFLSLKEAEDACMADFGCLGVSLHPDELFRLSWVDFASGPVRPLFVKYGQVMNPFPRAEALDSSRVTFADLDFVPAFRAVLQCGFPWSTNPALKYKILAATTLIDLGGGHLCLEPTFGLDVFTSRNLAKNRPEPGSSWFWCKCAVLPAAKPRTPTPITDQELGTPTCAYMLWPLAAVNYRHGLDPHPETGLGGARAPPMVSTQKMQQQRTPPFAVHRCEAVEPPSRPPPPGLYWHKPTVATGELCDVPQGGRAPRPPFILVDELDAGTEGLQARLSEEMVNSLLRAVYTSGTIGVLADGLAFDTLTDRYRWNAEAEAYEPLDPKDTKRMRTVEGVCKTFGVCFRKVPRDYMLSLRVWPAVPPKVKIVGDGPGGRADALNVALTVQLDVYAYPARNTELAPTRKPCLVKEGPAFISLVYRHKKLGIGAATVNQKRTGWTWMELLTEQMTFREYEFDEPDPVRHPFGRPLQWRIQSWAVQGPCAVPTYSRALEPSASKSRSTRNMGTWRVKRRRSSRVRSACASARWRSRSCGGGPYA